MNTTIPAGFWGQIEHQLDRIETEKPSTFDAIREILTDPGYAEIVKENTRNGVRGEHLPTNDPAHDPDAAFFAGSGGDSSLWESLWVAGWSFVRQRGAFHYAAQHPISGEWLTYIEGDVLRGDKIGATP